MKANFRREGTSNITWDEYLDNSSVCLHSVDSKGDILWANDTELEFVGLKPEEYVGRSITEFHADEPVINDILTRLTNDETLNAYPARLKLPDGSIKHVVINSNVYREKGEFVHTRCFTTCIDEEPWKAVKKDFDAKVAAAA